MFILGCATLLGSETNFVSGHKDHYQLYQKYRNGELTLCGDFRFNGFNSECCPFSIITDHDYLNECLNVNLTKVILQPSRFSQHSCGILGLYSRQPQETKDDKHGSLKSVISRPYKNSFHLPTSKRELQNNKPYSTTRAFACYSSSAPPV